MTKAEIVTEVAKATGIEKATVQIVVEHDMSRNLLKEVGFTSVPVDF